MPSQPKMIETNCVICDGEFTTRASDLKRGKGRKYCSTDCRYSTKRKKVNCGYCGEILIKKTSSTSKYYFCDNDCKYNAACDIENPYQTGPREKKIGIHTYRKRAFRLLENKCIRCGYDEHKELLDVDHIDGDRRNNVLENLQILCVMCHAIKTRKSELF